MITHTKNKIPDPGREDPGGSSKDTTGDSPVKNKTPMNGYNVSVAFKKSNIFILIITMSIIATKPTAGQDKSPELPVEKQTTLGLYVTAKEAYEKWQQAPDEINILDVRTPEEYIYIGHAPMAWNIPAFIQTHNWDSEKQHFSIKPSAAFINHIKEVFKPTDTLYVMCRSGGRSAWAVNQLAEAGYQNVYNITDGFEGDAVSDTGSLYKGQRLKNGWKNSGIPWTYKVERALIKLPEEN
jgi:rhodanese-related sulfurtransferase